VIGARKEKINERRKSRVVTFRMCQVSTKGKDLQTEEIIYYMF
jgi:hypothetical protein